MSSHLCEVVKDMTENTLQNLRMYPKDDVDQDRKYHIMEMAMQPNVINANLLTA